MVRLFFTSALIFSSTLLASPLDMQMMHTKPVCQHENQSPAWCTYDDLVPVSEASGMVAKINEQIDLATNPETARIFVAYLSFSNKPVARKLCEKAKLGIPIEFFLDSAAPTENPKIIEDMKSCKTADDRLTVSFHFLGVKPTPWRLHHNKFLIVDPGPESQALINFSSGNLSAFGTSLHFDHWVTVKTDKTSSFYKNHICVIQALKKAIDPDQDGIDEAIDDPIVYRDELDACFTEQQTLPFATALEQEKIAPLFSPNPKNLIAKTLIREIESVLPGEKIQGAIQHFLHYGIANALIAAANKGVEVTMLMDNDVLSGESEVEGVTDFFKSVLDNTKIEFRFMETNAEAHQMMHNKFLILGTQKVFAGAGHFTTAAMTDSYENFYLMLDETIHKQYSELFVFMHNMSVSKEDVLKKIKPQENDDEPINPGN